LTPEEAKAARASGQPLELLEPLSVLRDGDGSAVGITDAAGNLWIIRRDNEGQISSLQEPTAAHRK
jgi:hypothetical protein